MSAGSYLQESGDCHGLAGRLESFTIAHSVERSVVQRGMKIGNVSLAGKGSGI